ncbi:MAG: hypothetical protein ACHQLQ_10650, partial [Candidatus Acidiferrales bacterium]
MPERSTAKEEKSMDITQAAFQEEIADSLLGEDTPQVREAEEPSEYSIPGDSLIAEAIHEEQFGNRLELQRGDEGAKDFREKHG